MKRIILVTLILTMTFWEFSIYCEEDIVKRLHNLVLRLNQARVSEVEIVYDSRGRRDPFVPLIGLERVLPRELTDEEREGLPNLPSLKEIKSLYPFTLLGIVFSKTGESLAIITDGKTESILRVGDQISGAKVLDIKIDSVKLLWKKKEIYLTLRQ